MLLNKGLYRAISKLCISDESMQSSARADIPLFSSIFKDRLQDLRVLEGLPFRMGKLVSAIHLSQIGKRSPFWPWQ